jgi:pimeloyl-ACP methyl ester carboxylesterase
MGCIPQCQCLLLPSNWIFYLILTGLQCKRRSPDQLRTPALFIVARNDTSGDGPRLPRIRAAFEKVTGPKELVVVDGDAHAQFLFESDQADRVMRENLRFLSAR